MEQSQIEIDLEKRVQHRIGLALSGGGYRASLFHLGVIRRLEELGIMQDVSVISCISGGSIIGAFYTTEMEQCLRSRRDQIAQIWQGYSGYDREEENKIKLKIAKIRLELFEEIAEKFFLAMDKNMRMRATVFAPFFHISWIRARFSKNYTRAELIQREYDKWLFHNGVVDFIPSYNIINETDLENRRKRQKGYRLHPGYHVYKTDNEIRAQFGTKVIINATSLLNGEIKSFYRVPIWGFSEMMKTNENIEKISKVVGASSAVPGVFPPAMIGGDVLVDGGVSDNQGLHVFLKEEQKAKHHAPSGEEFEDCDVLLVSDASGQMLKKDQMGRKMTPVLIRSQGIQSFELRNKNIDLLVEWRRGKKRKGGKVRKGRLFAFVQLYRSLKDREGFVGQNRVPSEYISALGGIRTDLDQFSHIEREALMYHGYTLIDSQLREWCGPFLEDRGLDFDINSKTLNQRLANQGKVSAIQKFRKPPLFRESHVHEWRKNIEPIITLIEGLRNYQQFRWNAATDKRKKLRKYRTKIKNHLEIGKSLILTSRLFKDHPIAVILYYTFSLSVVYFAFRNLWFIQREISEKLVDYLEDLVHEAIPDWVSTVSGWMTSLFGFDIGEYFKWPITDPGMNLIATLLIIAVGGYLIIGLFYRLIGQPLTIWLDKRLYKQLTGKNIRKAERTHWEVAAMPGYNLFNFRICTQRPYRWPEAIDVDRNGTIYFSDLFEKALYRIKRDQDGQLDGEAEKLIDGFKHVSGISIDWDSNLLYLGIRVDGSQKTSWRIVKLPINLLDACAQNPQSYAETKMRLHEAGVDLEEYPIEGQPNGVVCVPRSEGTVYYTNERLLSLFGKGYIGSIQSGEKYDELKTPNGIDIDRSARELTLVFSLFRKHAIARMTLGENKQEQYDESEPSKKRILGFGPGLDGLITLENGDVLAAAYWWGEVLYFAWDGSSYASPITIMKGLGNPTDLAIGPSADGKGESLYVTSTKLLRALLRGSPGKVVEVPDIRNQIAHAQNGAGGNGR